MLCNLALHTQATTFQRVDCKKLTLNRIFYRSNRPSQQNYFYVLFWLLFNRCRRAEFIKKNLSKKQLLDRGLLLKVFPESIKQLFFASFCFFLLHLIVSCLSNLLQTPYSNLNIRHNPRCG